MRQPENWKMTPLDAMLCSNQLQILKTLVFFFPPVRQRQIILLIKFIELRECLSLPLSSLTSYGSSPDNFGQGTEMFEHIFPYCDQEHQRSFKQMQNAFQMMQTVRQFSDSGMFDNLSQMMGGMGGFGENEQAGSMFSSMLNPEQQALFKEYEAMLDNL